MISINKERPVNNVQLGFISQGVWITSNIARVFIP